MLFPSALLLSYMLCSFPLYFFHFPFAFCSYSAFAFLLLVVLYIFCFYFSHCFAMLRASCPAFLFGCLSFFHLLSLFWFSVLSLVYYVSSFRCHFIYTMLFVFCPFGSFSYFPFSSFYVRIFLVVLLFPWFSYFYCPFPVLFHFVFVFGAIVISSFVIYLFGFLLFLSQFYIRSIVAFSSFLQFVFIPVVRRSVFSLFVLSI